MQMNENQNALWYLFSKTWHYSVGNRKNVTRYWVMFILAELIDTIFSPLIWAKMIEVVTLQGINASSIKTLYMCLGLIILRMIISWSFHGPARCLERNNAFKTRTNYWKHLLKGVVTLPLEWHVEHHTGDTIDKVNKGGNALFDFAEVSFIPIRCTIQLTVSFIMIAYFSQIAAAIVIIMLLVSAWITMRFDKVLIEQYKELNKSENQISESIIDAISNISTIIVLRVEKLVFDAIIHKVEKPYELFRYNQRLGELKWFLTSVCCNTMTVTIIMVYCLQHWGSAPGTLVASFYILINYLDRISELFFRFTEMYSDIVRRKARVLNAEQLASDFRIENFGNHVLPKNWRRLDVENLSFSYYHEDGSDLHLNNVYFSVKSGERVALIGETGSGKSTFLKVMRDLYHPRELKLLVDGQEISQGFEGISRAISLAQQDPEIFANSIFANITMGAEHEMEFVKKFTDMACFTEVAMSLPNQFDSSIKEKGVNLSGGQQQRLALSRGLLAGHDKDIVLLDEPTSSLDMITEITVYQNIFREFKDKTVISTVHQLHLLPLFDRVCVFDKGQIVGSGTISELQANCPTFIALWGAMQNAATNQNTCMTHSTSK